MDYIFPPIARPSVPVRGQTRSFAVRRIFCVGRNYNDHVKEMGGDPARSTPFYFCKPADALVPDGATIPYPMLTQDIHHEIELVIAIGAPGRQTRAADAERLIYGYAVGIDLTRRDLQAAARAQGQPWDFAKGFDDSAPCGQISRLADTGLINEGRIWLSVNGAIRQDANLRDLIWKAPELLSNLSHGVALQPGDLVYTGTPAGVGPLVPGDRVTGGIDGLGEIGVTIGEALR
jgi:fumarylpyruvate hydrolase